MKLKYPHARLAVYNQLLLGRGCAEALTEAARECGLDLLIEPAVLSAIRAEQHCQAFAIAQQIFAQVKPNSVQHLNSKLGSLVEQYQITNKQLTKITPLAVSPNSCGGLNCTGLAPVILDFVLQSLDEVDDSPSPTSGYSFNHPIG
jgi:hypothetical protein